MTQRHSTLLALVKLTPRDPPYAAVGGVFLITQWPESRWPGRFDYWLQSHQFWHSCHTLAGLVQFLGQRSARPAVTQFPCDRAASPGASINSVDELRKDVLPFFMDIPSKRNECGVH